MQVKRTPLRFKLVKIRRNSGYPASFGHAPFPWLLEVHILNVDWSTASAKWTMKLKRHE